MSPNRILFAAAALALALPAAAHADSIVYIDGGNVWSASPDGARKVQLTTGGGWHSPTQADDGTIAAVQGTGPIVVMGRDGRPLHTITTAPQRSADGGTFAARPVELAFSPDGTKLAYAYLAYSCPPASSCGSIQRSTFYTDAGVTQATDVAVYGNQFSVSDPSWVNNRRTLVSGGFGSQVSIDDLGPGDYSQKPWMVPNGDMGDPEVSRDGKRLAVTFDYGANKAIAWFAVTGDVATELPPAYPEHACHINHGDQNFASPTWSPDGNGIAYQSSEGIVVRRFSAFGPELCEVSDPAVLSATGSEPDWGPADPPAAAYTPAPPAPGPTPTPAPAPAPAPKRAAFVTKRATAKALRKGLVVKVRVPAAGKVSVVASAKGKKIASGSATAKRAGVVGVRLSKARVHGKTLKLKLTFNGSSVSRSVALR